MEAWTWLIIGLALLAGELFVPTGFYLLILGSACLVVGGLSFVGVLVTWMMQVAVFSVATLVIWYLFGDKLQALLRSKEKEYGGLLGQTAVAREAIEPGHKGGGELWGSPWRLENIGKKVINPNDECEVVSSDGLVLKVKGKE